MMCAIDLPDGETRDQLVQACMSAALLAPACGERSLRFRPPLTVDADEIDEARERLSTALRKVRPRAAIVLPDLCRYEPRPGWWPGQANTRL